MSLLQVGLEDVLHLTFLEEFLVLLLVRKRIHMVRVEIVKETKNFSS